MEKIVIFGKQSVEIKMEITPEDLGRAIFGYLSNKHSIDDAGCDWRTYEGAAYIDNSLSWCVSIDENFVTLVNAANILIYGHVLTLE